MPRSQRHAAGGGELDAVLPLRLTDYQRFRILDRSLRKNFRPLRRCWVVTTRSEFGRLQELVGGHPYTVISETDIVPEITTYRLLYRVLYGNRWTARRLAGRFDATGWFVQQLVKLAIAERVETDFYLTLDSDVICMKPVRYEDLVRDGRAVTNIREEDIHPDWYRSSEHVLGMARSGRTHGVTPALFARGAVLELQEYLAERSRLGGWRSHLLRNTPWTEYTLYHTYLEGAGRYDTYHVDGGPAAIYDNEHSVWFASDFEDARIEEFMRGDSQFLVVQSNTGTPPEDVWKKVRAHLD